MGTNSGGNPDFDGEMLGDYQGGHFAVQAYSLDGQNVKIRASGWFGDAEHIINENYNVKLLTVKEQSRVTIEFLESMAGYCSAVFLQQYVPNTGQAQPAGASLTDDERYWVMPSDMVFESGSQSRRKRRAYNAARYHSRSRHTHEFFHRCG